MLGRVKPLDAILATAEKKALHRSLGAVQLTLLGIGSVIGTGIFVLGAVLEQFFARYASINSFTETALRSLGRGEIMRWVPRCGTRPIL